MSRVALPRYSCNYNSQQPTVHEHIPRFTGRLKKNLTKKPTQNPNVSFPITDQPGVPWCRLLIKLNGDCYFPKFHNLLLMRYTRSPKCCTPRPAFSHPAKKRDWSLPILLRQLIRNIGDLAVTCVPANWWKHTLNVLYELENKINIFREYLTCQWWLCSQLCDPSACTHSKERTLSWPGCHTA